MAVLGDPRDKARTTLVTFHDLLGFGDLLASSGGTLDSDVGVVAYKRVRGLRQSVDEVEALFPDGTAFFHLNDMLMACLDVAVEISSAHTDPSGIGAIPPGEEACLVALRFLGAAAALHQQSIGREEEERLGPAGRTFVVLGKRWDVESRPSARVLEVPALQANLAFAEAYAADKGGATAGFSHRNYYRLYVNDYLWFLLSCAKLALSPDRMAKLQELGSKNCCFPRNLLAPETSPIRIDIFHRERMFYSLMSHHACDIGAALKIEAGRTTGCS